MKTDDAGARHRRRPRVAPFICAALLIQPNGLVAQAATDLFIVYFHEADARIVVDSAARLTDRAGYDNQPQFTPDGRSILYTSIDEGQADIYRYDIARRRTDRVTHTAPESEYSATPMPGGNRFSVIRVEADSTQRLWSFAVDGTDPRVVFEQVMPVGYHAWIDADRAALFVLGSPATLQLADLRGGSARVIAENIGRSLHRIPGTTSVSFVHREGEGAGMIRRWDADSGAMSPLAPVLADNEYHAWTPSGLLISASGSVLYQWSPGRDEGWVRVADLAAHGMTGITRLAVNPGGGLLAVVAAH